MHELPIVKEILNIALRYAEENHAGAIRTIQLEIGELHDLVPEWVEKFFRFASKGTIAERAEIQIRWYPVIGRCTSCGECSVLHLRTGDELCCPLCAGKEFQIVSGKEFQISKIEVI